MTGAWTAKLVIAAVAAAHAASPQVAVTIDDFAHGARGWTHIGSPALRTTDVRGDHVLTVAARGRTSVGLSRALPAGWTVSLDLQLSRGAHAVLDLGAAGSLAVRSERGRVVAGRGVRVHRSAGTGGWYRLEAATARAGAALDGQNLRTTGGAGAGQVAIRVTGGSVRLRAFVASPADEPAGLLLQRLAWLHTRTPPGRFPVGLGADGRIHFSRSWTSGFWAGSLWHAFDLTGSAMFKRWALAATLDNMGREHADTHDLGFMYETSSVVAYDHLCRNASAPECPRLRRSALTAANSLLALAASNRATGTIPTSAKGVCKGCGSSAEADTIVDSVMNLPLLFWASQLTGDPRYRDLAARHAHIVAQRMVRSDGSTWSSMHTRRSDGSFIRYHTHQGYRTDSTWARGQAWAISGFAYAANALGDHELLAVAERTAQYVMRRLPKPAVPRYDYDAPAGAPHDVSAAVITAAGMLRLAAACDRLAATCDPSAQALRDYAHGMLSAALAEISTRPPLGLLTHQVYGLGGATSWDDDAELIFGINFALEGIARGA